MRTTAKTTPVTVTSSRTLSCTRFRQASSESSMRIICSFVFTASFDVTPLSTVQKKSPPLQTLDDAVNGGSDHRLFVAPREAFVRDQQRGNAVDGSPGAAGGDVRIDLAQL